MIATEKATSRFAVAAILAVTALAVPLPEPAVAKAGEGSEIANDYVSALQVLVTGETERAVAEHIAAEIRHTPGGTSETVELLDNRQMAIARRLASASSEGLIPIIRLHESAYLAHLDNRRLPLAIRSRRFAVELIELYVTVSDRPDAERLGSELITSLAGYLQQSTLDSAAIDLYQRALTLDGDNGAARLGLASLFERQGKYDRTLPHLETILRYPDRHLEARVREARLRLGVNFLRLERFEEGVAALEQLRAAPQSDWITSLAYQELARQASLDGLLVDARELLSEATKRLPDDACLAVQIAFLADRTGGESATTQLRRTLEATAASSKPSPRALYASSSGVALSELRVSNSANARRRLPPLQDALSRWAGNRGSAP